MKIIISEDQNNRLISEDYYNSDNLYPRDYIISRLKRAPKYMHGYIKNLPYIECADN